MATKPLRAAHHTATAPASGELAALVAGRMSPATISTYTTAVGQLAAFLAAQGMPSAPAAITREHVEAFITSLLARWKPATAHNRYRGCQAFFGWLVEACERDRTFLGRRDKAILRCFIDTGARRGEILGLTMADVDLDLGRLTVTGKGDRQRYVAIGDQTIRSLDRYLRARGKHPGARLAALWLGHKGALRESGLAELIRDRGHEAGIPGRLHPHLFRHAYAHAMLAALHHRGRRAAACMEARAICLQDEVHLILRTRPRMTTVGLDEVVRRGVARERTPPLCGGPVQCEPSS